MQNDDEDDDSDVRDTAYRLLRLYVKLEFCFTFTPRVVVVFRFCSDTLTELNR
jgi:hypothetical protein